MQLRNVRVAYVLIGAALAVGNSACTSSPFKPWFHMSCERYVTNTHTLSVAAITGQIHAVSTVKVEDLKWNNQFPPVSEDVMRRDQAQYEACTAIDRMPDGDAKAKRQDEYVGYLLDILKETAAQNPGAVSAKNNTAVGAKPVTPTVTKMDIAQPIVNQPTASYPQVKLRAGQTINIAASGCVQTGGAGKTWKRYVDPDPSDKYYGTITVDGLYNNTPIRDIVGKPFVVPAAADGKDLVLGYVDDNYSDNGYWGHDDGTNNQCQNIGPASVSVTVTQ